MTFIDLRSDTVTKPGAGMREAIASAEVGDDIYGEDPCVNALQNDLAAKFGMEAALFVPTGSMGNQLAIKAHTDSGDEVIVEKECHIFNYETAGPSMWSAVQLHPVPGNYGVPTVEAIEEAIRPPEYYYPKTTLVCLENTHNRAGGAVFPLQRMKEIKALCDENGLNLHLDGARIWNAHIASGISLEEYGKTVDSINVCFSKGLGAPIGSMLLGTREMITKAHKYRKVFGGAMRQVGVLAAAAQYAVENNMALLAEDQRRARHFAESLKDCSSFSIDIEHVETNMVVMDFAGSEIGPATALERLAEAGVIIGMGRGKTLRAVFHLDLNDEQVELSIEIFKKLFA
jgi:threonine aldolase